MLLDDGLYCGGRVRPKKNLIRLRAPAALLSRNTLFRTHWSGTDDPIGAPDDGYHTNDRLTINQTVIRMRPMNPPVPAPKNDGGLGPV